MSSAQKNITESSNPFYLWYRDYSHPILKYEKLRNVAGVKRKKKTKEYDAASHW